MIADHLDEVVFKNLADDNQESIRVTGCGVFMPKGIVSISYWRTIDKTATGYGVFILAFCNAGLILCVFLYLKEGHTFVIRQAVIRNLPEEVRVVCHAEELSNMWVSSLTRFIPEHIYNLGNQPIDMEALKGRDCYGGLDLSSTGDITAFVLIFPPRVPEEKYIMLPFFWIPEDTIPQRVRRASVPYDIWYQQGYLIATEGNVIHYGFIEKVIEELGKTYHIKEIAFDRWGAVQMTQNLEGMGFTVVPFGQGFKDMSPPTKEFYKLLMEGRIIHGGNPVMAWMAGNVVVDTDPAGNIKPTKAKSPEKIDGIVAAIMALDRCIRNEGQQQGSVYDERDMIVF